MKKSIKDCKTFALKIVNYYPRILPATEVISEAKSLAEGWLTENELGLSEKGHPIQLLSLNLSRESSALMYGFPDPGEAVGGTGMLCLMRALKEKDPFFEGLNLNWNFIPCLNFDDQPNMGKTLEKVMKTGEQEVDWLVPNPRPETTALLKLARQLRPRLVFPLHDEWHCREEIPCYMPVSKPLPKNVCVALRSLLESFGLRISTEVIDPVMGQGFLNMGAVGDIENSTFFEFGKNGVVFICEVPDLLDKSDSTVIAAQLAAVLFVAANCSSE